MKRSKRLLVGGARTCRSDVIVIRVVDIAVLVLQPTVSAMLFVCSIEMGIGNTFSAYF